MPRNLLMAFTIVGALAVPTAGFACLSLDVDGSIAAITQAMQKDTVSPADREKVERLLAQARTAKSSGNSGGLDLALMDAARIVNVGLVIGPSSTSISASQGDEPRPVRPHC
jgi:hypothetical protein